MIKSFKSEKVIICNHCYGSSSKVPLPHLSSLGALKHKLNGGILHLRHATCLWIWQCLRVQIFGKAGAAMCTLRIDQFIAYIDIEEMLI